MKSQVEITPTFIQTCPELRKKVDKLDPGGVSNGNGEYKHFSLT